ncbi:hypothetical protein JCM3765_005284 [Sporobolomyces pararoseus]
MNPFPADSSSSAGTKMMPSVSSPSLLAREPRPPQAKRLGGPRPFLLRSTTPLKAAEQPLKPTPHDAQTVEQAKLPRSKTETALNKPHSTSQSKPALPPHNSVTTSSRRSSRPISTAPASASAKSLPIRASRKIIFVPDPSPSPSSSSRPTSVPRSSKAGSSVEKVQAVEKRKMELKRESLMSRRNGQNSFPSPMAGGGAATGGEGSENAAPQPTTTSRRWSLRPVRDSLPRRATSSLALNQTGPDSPSPSPLARRNAPNPLNNVTVDSPLSRRVSIRGPAGPSEPIQRSASSNQLRKKDSYAALSRAPLATTHEAELARENEEVVAEVQEGAIQRSKTVYTSLQEVLAERGYQDTRVLTPNSKAQAKKTTTTEPSSFLLPPQPQVKEKTSMLSLRGLFSLWGPNQDEGSKEDGEQEVENEEGEAEGPPSPNGSGGTFTVSPISRAREWAQGVAIATAQDQARSPTSESTSFTPPFQYSLSATEDSPASSRSYSSSIVTASSIRSPPQVTIALPASTVALSPPSFHRFPATTLSPPSKSQAIKSLRHVVSDSTLPQHLPHYTSFPFSPSSLDSSASHGFSSSPAASAVDHLLSPYDSTRQSHKSPQLSTPLLEAQTSWLPTSLRHRASQVFSLPMVGLGLTSATPIFPNSRQTIQGQSGIARTRQTDKKKPKLLRKAVSSAGLVRPVLTTTNY